MYYCILRCNCSQLLTQNVITFSYIFHNRKNLIYVDIYLWPSVEIKRVFLKQRLGYNDTTIYYILRCNCSKSVNAKCNNFFIWFSRSNDFGLCWCICDQEMASKEFPNKDWDTKVLLHFALGLQSSFSTNGNNYYILRLHYTTNAFFWGNHQDLSTRGSDIHRSKAESWQILILTSKEWFNCFVIYDLFILFFIIFLSSLNIVFLKMQCWKESACLTNVTLLILTILQRSKSFGLVKICNKIFARHL